ncbi:MAG: HAMP domain-containing histidine kinase [Bacteroidia bacterium]|nr:HAMP domain-containing histidine kinase [Bacteroidia bacterium]
MLRIRTERKTMEFLQPRLQRLPEKVTSPLLKRWVFSAKQFFVVLLKSVKTIGFTDTMEEYEQRKLGIFNQLNFFQLVTGILIPVVGLFNDKDLPSGSWVVACLPALVSVLALYLNKLYKHEAALFSYFILYPFITCIVYMYGLNLGVNLSFIFYGILAVFFFKDIGYMMFSIGFSMVSYYILSIVLKHYEFQLETINNGLYLLNQVLAISFIFLGLYLIKKENSIYQSHVLDRNRALQEKNIQIQEQADKIKENAILLKNQTEELTELNSLKNKLFSVVSHDMRAPMYALRNLFINVQQEEISQKELKVLIPDVVNDLNYTVGLMDNLLQWAKTQMKSDIVYPQKMDIGKSITEVIKLMRLQAEAKKIKIECSTGENIYGVMDRDMLNLVLRNLLSNAIKFTPDNGTISISVQEKQSFIEVYVKDNGTGISQDALMKINDKNFYSTKGTASEAGSGLGLMLCKEYLARNGGRLHIESKIGKGSIFSFALPKSA